jgi:hypothetical protein
MPGKVQGGHETATDAWKSTLVGGLEEGRVAYLVGPVIDELLDASVLVDQL